jgi:hypothetical protein
MSDTSKNALSLRGSLSGKEKSIAGSNPGPSALKAACLFC